MSFKPVYAVLVTGDRDYTDMPVVEGDCAALLESHSKGDLVIIHGGAPGLDTIWDIVAEKNSIHRLKCDALWATRYRGAGPQRNSVMGRVIFQLMYAADDYAEDDTSSPTGECLAYHNNIKASRGTKNMVKWCLRHDIPVFPRGFKLKDVK